MPLGKSPLFGAGGFLEMILILGVGALLRSRRKVQLLKRCALGIRQPLCPSCQCISHQEHVGHFPNKNVGSLFETKHVTGCWHISSILMQRVRQMGCVCLRPAAILSTVTLGQFCFCFCCLWTSVSSSVRWWWYPTLSWCVLSRSVLSDSLQPHAL